MELWGYRLGFYYAITGKRLNIRIVRILLISGTERSIL